MVLLLDENLVEMVQRTVSQVVLSVTRTTLQIMNGQYLSALIMVLFIAIKHIIPAELWDSGLVPAAILKNAGITECCRQHMEQIGLVLRQVLSHSYIMHTKIMNTTL